MCDKVPTSICPSHHPAFTSRTKWRRRSNRSFGDNVRVCPPVCARNTDSGVETIQSNPRPQKYIYLPNQAPSAITRSQSLFWRYLAMMSESLTLQPGTFTKPHQEQNSLYGGGKRCDMQQKPPASFCADPDQVGFGRGRGSISRMAFDGWGNGETHPWSHMTWRYGIQNIIFKGNKNKALFISKPAS